MKKRVQARGNGRQEDSKVPMAAMIDVVFLLLVFFVLTVRPVDVLAHLDASQAGGGSGAPGLKVDVLEDGYRVNGRPVQRVPESSPGLVDPPVHGRGQASLGAGRIPRAHPVDRRRRDGCA